MRPLDWFRGTSLAAVGLFIAGELYVSGSSLLMVTMISLVPILGLYSFVRVRKTERPNPSESHRPSDSLLTLFAMAIIAMIIMSNALISARQDIAELRQTIAAQNIDRVK